MDGVWTALQFPGAEGCLHRWWGVSSSVAKGVLIGGGRYLHRWQKYR